MIDIVRNASLRSLNTFGVECVAEELVSADSENAIVEALDTPKPVTILGGGSNTIFLERIAGRVVLIENLGHAIEESGFLHAGAGVDWHTIVMWSLDQGLGGLENLALIPGSVGAAPYQNIGAYGRELSELVHRVDAVDRETLEHVCIAGDECDFGYRDSRFKSADAGRFVITSVVFDLRNVPRALDYPDVRARVSGDSASRRKIADAVIAVRSAKLPDPAEIGNVGSFFKNPVVNQAQYEYLRDNVGIEGFQTGDGFKISAARLIDELGWKGTVDGNVGVWERQPLVLVNRGGASGREVLAVAERIRSSVADAFGILLEQEPVVAGER